MTDVSTKPNEWRTEFPVEWTAVQPEPAPEPAAALALIPKQRTSSESTPRVVVKLPDVVPPQRTPQPPDVTVVPRATKLARRPRTAVLAAEGMLSLAVAGAGVGVAVTSGGSSSLSLNGTVTIAPSAVALKNPNFVMKNGACEGSGEYADLVPGAFVTLVNAQGTPTDFGRLGAGTVNPQAGCQLTWQMAKAPKQPLYRVVIGRRGMQIFTKPQLAAGFNSDFR